MIQSPISHTAGNETQIFASMEDQCAEAAVENIVGQPLDE